MKQNVKPSSENIYALLDDIDSNDQENLDNLMNASDIEFVDMTAIENLENDNPKAVIHEKDDSNVSNFILTRRPTEVVARIAKPGSGSVDNGDVPLSNLVAKRCCLEM